MTDTNSNTPAEQNLPLVQRIVSILWPSFVTASLATILFFVVFDPMELGMLAGLPELSATGGYTIGFFFFWIMNSIGCAMTCFFRKPCPPRVQTRDQN
jgi:hypothetical protein